MSGYRVQAQRGFTITSKHARPRVRGAKSTGREPSVPAETLDLAIDSLAAGGDGVGRAPDGRVVFVPLTAPGDRVRVALHERRSRFSRGRLMELLEAGPDRIAPLCPEFGRCGGCAWQHVDYPAQLRAKTQILADALERLAGLSLPEPISITPSPSPFAYRARSRVLHVGGKVGFRKLRSNAVCAVDRCPVLTAPVERALAQLAAEPPTADGEWELAAGDAEVRCVSLATGDGPRIALTVGDDRLQVSPGVFYQANPELLTPIARAVAAAAGSGRHGVELFAGAGFLTLGLARQFARVTAVESHPAAVSDLIENLRTARAENVDVVASRVEDAFDVAPLADARPDVVVLDPPRSGLPGGVTEAMIRAEPERIVYLSCDPATLARDLKAFAAAGYSLGGITAFDLFPQTAHVEALALISRSPTR